MAVGATEAEGRDAGAMHDLAPVQELAGHDGREAREVDVAVQVVEPEVSGDEGLLQREHHLANAGDARGALQVAQVGLQGAEHQGLLHGAALAVHRPLRAHLDGGFKFVCVMKCRRELLY